MTRAESLRRFCSSTAGCVGVCLGVLLFCLAVSPGRASANAQAPVAEYSFDSVQGEPGEETVSDLTGNGHTATIEGAKWTTHGRYGGAMQFHGAEGEFLSVPASPEFDLGEEMTVEAWIRPESESDQWAPIVAKEFGGGTHANELAWWLYGANFESDTPNAGTESAPDVETKVTSPDQIPVDVWSHIAVTWDGDIGRLYVDGELVAVVARKQRRTADHAKRVARQRQRSRPRSADRDRADDSERARYARRQSRRHLELYARGERRHVGVVLLFGERWHAIGRR